MVLGYGWSLAMDVVGCSVCAGTCSSCLDGRGGVYCVRRAVVGRSRRLECLPGCFVWGRDALGIVFTEFDLGYVGEGNGLL